MTEASVAAYPGMWDQLPLAGGRPCQQFRSDLDRYAELIAELRPPWILEVGTAQGGTAVFLADAVAATRGGRVIAVDIAPADVQHPGVIVVTGDAKAPQIAAAIAGLTGSARGMILLDGDHNQAQVTAELDLYAGLADYLIVEDTLMHWLPQYQHVPGPWEALTAWLPDHPEFAADPDPVPTNHPGGWLRRVAP